MPTEQFMESIKNCYLWRIYKNNISHELLAAWMCNEGDNKSRVVLGSLVQNKDKLVVVAIVREDRNNIAAPPRNGSALAN